MAKHLKSIVIKCNVTTKGFLNLSVAGCICWSFRKAIMGQSK